MMRQINKEATPSRYATSEWFYHAPLKQTEEGANAEIPIPPASQIPGLSDLAEPHNELANQSQRKWIKDTDSDYVKLSKQGGRPDLLKQVTPAPRKTSPVAYSIPDWYTHEAMTPPAKQTDAAVSYLPDYMVHEESKTEECDKYESRRGPFDFDKKTVWQRDSDDNEKENQGEKKHIKLPAIKPSVKPEKTTVVPNNVFPTTTTTKQEHPGKKVVFPPMHASRNSDPVNFSKLLSNGYGDEWVQKRNDRDKKAPQTSSNTEKPKDPALSS